VTYSDSSIKFLEYEDIDGLLQEIAETWPEHIIRVKDEALLDSALNRPKNAPDGLGLLDYAGMYFESFYGNHPLVDGNKRLGFFSVLQFLENNGYRLDYDQDEAYEFLIALVERKPFDHEAFKLWASEHIVKLRLDCAPL
jgi:death-on-curing protein